MTDLQAKRKALKQVRAARWKLTERWDRYVILFIDADRVESKPLPYQCSLKQARRTLQNHPGGKLFRHTYIPV